MCIAPGETRTKRVFLVSQPRMRLKQVPVPVSEFHPELCTFEASGLSRRNVFEVVLLNPTLKHLGYCQSPSGTGETPALHNGPSRQNGDWQSMQ